MPRVTPTERRLAHLQARDAARYERHSVAAAARLGFRAQRRVLAAWRQRQWVEIPGLAAAEIMKGKDELRDAMVLAYLVGLRRASYITTLSLSAADKAIRKLQAQTKLSTRQIRRLQEQFDTEAARFLTDISDDVEVRIRKAVNETLTEGMHVREGVAHLSKAFEAAGITPTNSFQLEAIFRTQMQASYGAARWQADQRPEIQEILWGYKYVTVGDDRVRPNHEALDGTTAPKDDPLWQTIWPPNGWACRCQCIGIYEEQEIVKPPDTVEIGGRAVVPGPDEGWAFNPGMLFERLEVL